MQLYCTSDLRKYKWFKQKYNLNTNIVGQYVATKITAKVQVVPEEITRPGLNATGIKCVQDIVVSVLFYGRAVDNKLIVALNNIGTQQDTATEITNDAINHLLDYLATDPNDVIVYIDNSMVIAAHSDAGFHNESKGRSWSGSHISLAEYEPVPRWNGYILTIVRVINFVMSSAAKSELCAIFITAK